MSHRAGGRSGHLYAAATLSTAFPPGCVGSLPLGVGAGRVGQQKLDEGIQGYAADMGEAEEESWKKDKMPVTQIKNKTTLQQLLGLRACFHSGGGGLFLASPII